MLLLRDRVGAQIDGVHRHRHQAICLAAVRGRTTMASADMMAQMEAKKKALEEALKPVAVPRNT